MTPKDQTVALDTITELATMLEDSYCARNRWTASQYNAAIKLAQAFVSVQREKGK